jgi:eukaryotic-like serine/threonine-protein kinase
VALAVHAGISRRRAFGARKLLVGSGMRAPAHVEGVDAERTRVDGAGPPPSSRQDPSLDGLGRGSILAGKYRLELLLGEGGMGSVWSAYHLELELPVAIKLLKAGLKNARLAERLRLEAQSSARLVHPSIVRVFDISATRNGDPFIVMELLSGESLAELLGRGRLSGARAVQLMLPIAEALALAHVKGIVHRDVKPDNVFISTNGEQLQPKLLDFGIAKLVFASVRANELTAKGSLIGSPLYMSPEQTRGDDVDYRSDIWSFCVVLYQAVTGAVPFDGEHKTALTRAILNDEPAPMPIDARVDKQLARLIRWGLTKDRAQRPTSVRELGRQLAQWLLANGVSDDACGAPLAAKWTTRIAEPSMRRPPPISVELESEPHVHVATLVSRPPPELPAERACVAAGQAIERIVPARRSYWALLAVASLLIAGGSVAWLTSVRDSGARSAMLEPIAELPPPPSSESPILATPLELTASPASPPQASVPAAHRLSDAASKGPTRRPRAKPPPLFPSSTPPGPRVATPKSSPSESHPATVAPPPFPVGDPAFELIRAY